MYNNIVDGSSEPDSNHYRTHECYDRRDYSHSTSHLSTVRHLPNSYYHNHHGFCELNLMSTMYQSPF